MDEQELENMLKAFGQVISTKILCDSSGTIVVLALPGWNQQKNW
jgi:hypothetical protein